MHGGVARDAAGGSLHARTAGIDEGKRLWFAANVFFRQCLDSLSTNAAPSLPTARLGGRAPAAHPGRRPVCRRRGRGRGGGPARRNPRPPDSSRPPTRHPHRPAHTVAVVDPGDGSRSGRAPPPCTRGVARATPVGGVPPRVAGVPPAAAPFAGVALALVTRVRGGGGACRGRVACGGRVCGGGCRSRGVRGARRRRASLGGARTAPRSGGCTRCTPCIGEWNVVGGREAKEREGAFQPPKNRPPSLPPPLPQQRRRHRLPPHPAAPPPTPSRRWPGVPPLRRAAGGGRAGGDGGRDAGSPLRLTTHGAASTAAAGLGGLLASIALCAGGATVRCVLGERVAFAGGDAGDAAPSAPRCPDARPPHRPGRQPHRPPARLSCSPRPHPRRRSHRRGRRGAAKGAVWRRGRVRRARLVRPRGPVPGRSGVRDQDCCLRSAGRRQSGGRRAPAVGGAASGRDALGRRERRHPPPPRLPRPRQPPLPPPCSPVGRTPPWPCARWAGWPRHQRRTTRWGRLSWGTPTSELRWRLSPPRRAPCARWRRWRHLPPPGWGR